MRIALLAPSGSGKTCYVVSLFGVLAHKLKKDAVQYPVKYEFTNSSQRNILQPQFRKMVRERGESRFPRSTDERTDYNMQLSLHADNDDYLDVTLVDYPGGVLTREYSESELIEEIIEDLSLFDGFIVLLDANDLFSEDPYETGESLADSQICAILEEARKQKYDHEFTQHGIPVVFGVTKFDETEKTLVEGKARIQELFPNFFNHHSDCIPAITAISLGEDITGSGKFDPLNIDTPFDICVALGVLSKALYERGISSDHETEADQYSSKARARKRMHPIDAFFDWVDDGFTLVSEYEADAKRHRQAEWEHMETHDGALSVATGIIETLEKNDHIKIFKPKKRGAEEVWFQLSGDIVAKPLSKLKK